MAKGMCLTLAAAAALQVALAAPKPGEVLIFEDTFDTFNLSVWKHEITLAGDSNWCFEAYLNNRTNSFVKNGTLSIQPTFLNSTVNLQSGELNLWGGDPATTCTDNGFFGCDRTGGAGGNIVNPIQSARIRTAESFAFKYGRVEVRARLPRGDWLWPAIWLLPTSAAYGQWPASGEVDIMESRGNARGYPGGGVESASSTMHWGPFWPENGYELTHESYTLPTGDLSESFHTYGLYWNASLMYTYIDDDTVPGNIILSVPINTTFWTKGGWDTNPALANPWEGAGMNAPFDQRFYLIMNLAVGGTNGYFPDGVGGKPWTDTSPNAMDSFWGAVDTWAPTWTSPFQIDSVRVWQTPGQGGDYAYRLWL